MLRVGLIVALLANLVLPGLPAAAQAGCTFAGGFSVIKALIPDRVGDCTANENYRLDIGESIQPTTNGTLVWHSVDGAIGFTDGSHTWVLAPSGGVQVRDVHQRFPWEFNGDGYPLVGASAPDINGPCPTKPVSVLAVENFYGSLVSQLAGQCAYVTTILTDPEADPHEFQPSANDIRAFSGAALVVENGLGYDDFADKAISTLSKKPQVLKAGQVVGLDVGANPHVWYSAAYVDQITAAIVASLKQVNPDASAYYDKQATWLDQAFGTYRSLINQIAAQYGGTPVASTESIFVDMAYTTGLNVISPPAFMQALSEGTDPTARDVATFQSQLKSRQVKVLVYNAQTITSTTEQLKSLARDNNIPVVGVSETLPLGASTFQGWQAGQLWLLLNALQQSHTTAQQTQ